MAAAVALGMAPPAGGPDAGPSSRAAGDPADLEACEAVDPAISPDGEQVVFVAVCDGDMDLWRVRLDGSEATRLSETPGEEHGPAWAPDGTRIAYAYAGEDRRSEVLVMAADGSGVRALTANVTTEWSPTWSPDGTRIAYESHRDGNADIYVLDLGSGRESRLTTHSGRDVSPAWSPDGATIAFQTDRDGPYAIYGIAADGARPPAPLILLEGDAVTPAWGPRGRRLAFAFRPAGGATTRILTARPGGTDAASVTPEGPVAFAPDWSRDGRWIAFMARTAEGGWAARLIRPDGSGGRALLPGEGPD